MPCMSRVLQRRDTSSLGRACQKPLEVETPFVREASECTELCLGMDDELSESLQARIREQTSMGDTVVSEHLLQALGQEIKWIRPSTDREQQPQNHRAWSSWGRT